MLEGELGSRSELEEVLETRGSEEAMASAAHGILETPHLHNGYLEALRTQWLIVEGVAVAGSAMVQICIDEESLAISTTCKETKVAFSLCLSRGDSQEAILKAP